jgi:hypothetical protein
MFVAQSEAHSGHNDHSSEGATYMAWATEPQVKTNAIVVCIHLHLQGSRQQHLPVGWLDAKRCCSEESASLFESQRYVDETKD